MVLIIYVNGLPKKNDKHPFQSKQISHCRVEQGGDTAKRIIDNVTWTVSFKTYKLIYNS